MSADPQTTPAPFDVSAFPPVSLAEVMDRAAQLTRVDRKYLVRRSTATGLLSLLPATFRVLTIDGRTSTGYRSTYFDTADLSSCRAHVQHRRNRWKARSRLYVEDGLCRLDVKTKDGRGHTVKDVFDLDRSRYGCLDAQLGRFISEVLAGHGIRVDPVTLRPSAEVRYRRATLADPEGGYRVTFDWDLQCALGGGRVWLDESWILVETKGGVRPSPVDRALFRLGARPRSFSKYVSAACLLRDDIADNDVRHLHGRLLHSARLLGRRERTPA